MKLVSLYIENFGKLHNENMSFSEGLNSFTRKNGWGKSTTITFIKAMLYGFSKTDKGERKYYKPWQGGNYGGYLIMEARGKRYRITRFFGDKEALDFLEVRDETTNLLTTELGDNPGETLFGINADSFMRTVFIRQSDSCNCHTNDEINARMGNITDGIDLNRFEKADKELKELENKLSDRKNSEGGKLIAKVGVINERIRKNRKVEDEFKRVERLLEEDKEDLKQAEKGISIIEERVKGARKQENLQKIRLDHDKLTGEVSNLWENLQCTNFLSPEGSLEDIRRDITSIANDFSERSDIVRQIEDGINEIRMEEYKRIPGKHPFGKHILFFILSLLCIVAGVGALIFPPYTNALKGIFTNVILYATVFSGVGIVFAFLAGISFLLHRKVKSVQSEKKERLLREVKSLTFEKENLDLRIGKALLKYGYAYSPENFQSDMQSIYNSFSEYQTSRLLYENAKKRLKSFEQEYDLSALTGDLTVTENLELLEHKLSNLRQQREDILERTRLHLNEMEEVKLRMAELYEDEDALKACQQQLEEKRLRYEYVSKTRELLSKARENLIAKYMGPLLNSFDKYYRIMTDDNSTVFRIDANTDLTMEEYGMDRDIASLSTGYRDLCGLCSRLAMTEVMFTNESPVLILDDPFVNYDDVNFEGAKKLMRAVGRNTQVLYFTCTKDRDVHFS